MRISHPLGVRFVAAADEAVLQFADARFALWIESLFPQQQLFEIGASKAYQLNWESTLFVTFRWAPIAAMVHSTAVVEQGSAPV
jgi:hypothetical protein